VRRTHRDPDARPQFTAIAALLKQIRGKGGAAEAEAETVDLHPPPDELLQEPAHRISPSIVPVPLPGGKCTVSGQTSTP
jgi:hypothetical protein